MLGHSTKLITGKAISATPATAAKYPFKDVSGLSRVIWGSGFTEGPSSEFKVISL
jgi:hypothetical protein